MASLVQDVWIGFEPRLRARRLGPWEEPRLRLLFQLDVAERLDEPAVAAFLEGLAKTIEVLAWEPRRRGQTGREGTLEAELLADARRLVTEGARAFGPLPVLLGGHGVGAWIALTAAAAGDVAGAVAIGPAIPEGQGEPEALDTPPGVPVLWIEARERPADASRRLAEWLARAPSAAHLVAPGKDADLLGPPWPAVVAAWAEALVLQ